MFKTLASCPKYLIPNWSAQTFTITVFRVRGITSSVVFYVFTRSCPPLVMDSPEINPSFCSASATVVTPSICTLNGKYNRFHVLGGIKNAFPARTSTCLLPTIDKPLVEIVLHSCSKIFRALPTKKLVLRSFFIPAGHIWSSVLSVF